MKYDLDFIVEATKGAAKSESHKQFSGFATDNRDQEIEGKLFIPLVGDNHDAHDYVTSAIENGATGVLVHTWNESWNQLLGKASFIQVKDTLQALQDFAKAWRGLFQGKVLALTGSNGKTTTKDFLFQILKNFDSVNASEGSFNNHWGVPFTLLRSDPTNRYCIVEMGMNHSGEIAKLMTIADPDLVTVTNVGRAHMGNFADGIEGVARAKEEIYELSKAESQLLFNLDNPWTLKMYEKYMDRASYTYSMKNFSADVYFRIKEKTATGLIIEGQIGGELGKAELSFWGDHNVENLAAAVAMAYIGGVKPGLIWPVLQNCHAGWGRNQWIETQGGLKVLFDGYNANPDSFATLLKNIATLTQQKKCVAVFGEMLELGDNAAAQHQELGEKAGELSWEKCVFIGPSAKDFEKGWQKSGVADNLEVFRDFEKMNLNNLKSTLSNSEIVVVKGSRGGALERVVSGLDPIEWTSLYSR